MWHVYIIQSEISGKLYTGITNNPQKRLHAHNKGNGAKATRAGRPWNFVYLEDVPNKGVALRRELVIKKLTRMKKLTLIQTQASYQKLPVEALPHYVP
jgi:putative endonuclease